MGFAAAGGKTHYHPKTSHELPSAARSQAKRELEKRHIVGLAKPFDLDQLLATIERVVG